MASFERSANEEKGEKLLFRVRKELASLSYKRKASGPSTILDNWGKSIHHGCPSPSLSKTTLLHA